MPFNEDAERALLQEIEGFADKVIRRRVAEPFDEEGFAKGGLSLSAAPSCGRLFDLP